MVSLDAAKLAAMRRHAEAEYPDECCGALLGIAGGEVKKASAIRPFANRREGTVRRRRFLITAEEMLELEKYSRSAGLDVLGFYHSHPDHPASPSGYDLEHAWPGYSYIIIPVKADGTGETLCWTLKPDRSGFDPETVTVA